MRNWFRIAAVSVLIVSPTVLTSTNAYAGPSSATYDVHAGDGFGPLTEPDVAAADNGDTVTVTAAGVLDAAARTASGSGTFQHRNAHGVLLASGSFAITGLTTFVPYGCQTDGLVVCGGRALLPIHITGHPASGGTVQLDGVLTVTCALGNAPAGAREGVKVNVQDVINFNRSTEGETVFVRH